MGVSALLLGTTVIAAGPQIAHREPMSEVSGGVMWTVGFEVYVGGSWNSSVLSLSDGQERVSWRTQSERLGNGSWASEYFGEVNLPGLALALTIVDFSGDGRLGPGDTLTFVATNGTSFAEGVTYSMMFGPPVQLIHGRYVNVEFEFRDGALHSRISVNWPRYVL